MRDARRRGIFRGLVVLAVIGAVGVGSRPVRAQTAVVPPGAGTQADPYLISELGHLVWMGENAYDSANQYYSLTADIDASATAEWNDAETDETLLEGFRPIGVSGDVNTTTFRGTFEGNGHSIIGLTIRRPEMQGVGLFGAIGGTVATGLVRNLVLVGGSVEGYSSVGSVVGSSYRGSVGTCSTSCAVSGWENAGGLLGYNYNGGIGSCNASGAVTGRSYVGGLVGCNYDGTVALSHATGMVTGDSYVGGLAGKLEFGTLMRSSAMGMVKGNAFVGGLAGQGYNGSVSSCWATGIVTSATSAGGLVGDDYKCTLSQNYANGAVSGIESVGGLVGSKTSGSVSMCYACGAVVGTTKVGGLVGTSSGATCVNSFWDTQTSGLSVSAGGTGKSTAQMKTQATFTGWNFTAVWGIVEGASYPYARENPSPFKLIVNVAGPGTVTADPVSADGTYALGTVVTLTAAWDAGQAEFEGWAGGTPSTATTATVVMDAPRSAGALFATRTPISSLAELAKIGRDPAYPLAGKHYDLTADIDASGTATWNDEGTDETVLEGFLPIGTAEDLETTSFRSVFDGHGHTISGLVINRDGRGTLGLFGCVGAGGVVRQVRLAGGGVTGSGRVGGLVGYSYHGSVVNCVVDATITGTTGVGGLVGYSTSDGVISGSQFGGVVSGTTNVGGIVGYHDAHADVSGCTVTGTVQGGSAVGGVVGSVAYGPVSNCQVSGQVRGVDAVGGVAGSASFASLVACSASGTVGGQTSVGGLLGWGADAVTDCQATGLVTGDSAVGGLIGWTRGVVTNCSAGGKVEGEQMVGGLVGELRGTSTGQVSNCRATGAVRGGWDVGGFCGHNGGCPIRGCFAAGAVHGDTNVGGLIGYMDTSGVMSDCYARGAVAGDFSVGGLLGMNRGRVANGYACGAVVGNEWVGGLMGANTGTVTGSFWDMETSGQSLPGAGTGKTTAQMKQQATFAGWDFVSVWGMQENVTYPLLRSFPTDADGDGVLDLLDQCPGTVAGAGVDGVGCPAFVPGDFNRDGDVDGEDLLAFINCVSGPDMAQTLPACGQARLDADDDVDQVDFGLFQRCFRGAGVPADPACAG